MPHLRSFPKNQIEGLDAYGIEFINRPTSEILKVYQQAAQSFGAGRLMVASAGYIINPEKSRTGNKHSAESQAKVLRISLCMPQ